MEDDNIFAMSGTFLSPLYGAIFMRWSAGDDWFPLPTVASVMSVTSVTLVTSGTSGTPDTSGTSGGRFGLFGKNLPFLLKLS